MANEKRLIPCGEKVTLDELPCGTLFAFGDDCIAVKSEYRCNNGLIEAFIIDSGEQFWGGAKTAKEQNELMVQPLEIVDAVEVVHARWRWGYNSMNQYGAWCAECECGWEDKGRDDDFIRVQGLVIAHKYCPNCGAKMDGGNEDV